MSQHVERREDMSQSGRLRLILQDDGGVIIAIVPDPDASSWERGQVEFCSVGSGGGRSPRTIEALRELAIAMALDNKDRSINGEPCRFKIPPMSHEEISDRAYNMDCDADECGATDAILPCRPGMCPEGCIFDEKRHQR